MSYSRLERLPAELLWRICEYVGHSHHPTMLSLAMTSKRCHSVAKRLLFHTIKFSVDSPLQLDLDVVECTGTLQRNSAFADVRTLVIDDGGKDKDKAGGRYNDTLTSRSRFSGLPPSPFELVDGHQDRIYGLERRSLRTAKPIERANSADQMDAAWQSLAYLVQDSRL